MILASVTFLQYFWGVGAGAVTVAILFVVAEFMALISPERKARREGMSRDDRAGAAGEAA